MKDTIGMMRTALRAAVLFAVSITFAATVDVTAPGEYASAGEATDFVVSGGIGGNVTILAADDGCRVTLSDTTLNGVLAIDGDAELRLAGANAITTTKKSAISCTGALSITGDGSMSLPDESVIAQLMYILSDGLAIMRYIAAFSSFIFSTSFMKPSPSKVVPM